MAERPADDDKSGEPHQPEPRSGDPTVRLPSPPESAERANEKRSPSRGSFTQRFPAGATIAGRYRVISLLGRGGMGEVYRADDLRLDQQVALKFLPRDLGADHEWLERLHNEVRLAREVAHPNVCRVYDVGDEHGDTFLSMEFVDGEDLASLLRRIGRVNPEKAVQIARQLCAGLAAAHERGVLHRDLKPANIMLDGRGSVRIMDFGLALRHEDGSGHIGMAGTPAYMAPEQWAGRDVTKATDIYALGLILFELFTGREAVNAESIDQYRQWHTQGSSHSLSDSLSSINPAVERIILRCLERDPRRRPQSALAVAAALPGGDPLAAALAAGETPSPSLVAAAGSGQRVSTWAAVAMLATILLGTLAVVLLKQSDRLWEYASLTKPPDVLVDRATDIMASLDLPATTGNSVWGFAVHAELIRWLNEKHPGTDKLARLQAGPFPAMTFYRRTSPAAMVAANAYGRMLPDDPPLTRPGMTLMQLDPQGRLIELVVIPQRQDAVESASSDPAVLDAMWDKLFSAAGLDRDAFDNVEPRWRPATFADARAAWLEREPQDSSMRRRIEAAAVASTPVAFAVLGPWAVPDDQATRETATVSESAPPGSRLAQRIAGWTSLTLLVVVTGTVIVLAVRHARAGRGDRRGAMVLAFAVLGVAMLRWGFLADVSLSPRFINSIFTHGVALALFGAALAWLLYMALEPYLRRLWPASLVTWLRLLEGRFRDPLLGRDLLIGFLGAVVISLLPAIRAELERRAGVGPNLQLTEMWAIPWLYAFNGGRRVIGLFMLAVQSAIVSPMILLLLILFLRFVLRKAWIAAPVFAILYTGLSVVASPAPLAGFVFGAVSAIVILVVLMRFGLVAGLGMQLFASLLAVFPVTGNGEAWYFTIGLFGVGAATIMAGYAFYVATAGKPTSGWSDEPA